MVVEFSPEEATLIGIEVHKAGNWQMAEAIYSRVLKVAPDNIDAQHFLGVVAIQIEKWDAAVEWIGKALSARPDDPAIISHYAAALNGLERHDEAEFYARRAVAMRPEMGTAFINLGNALRGQARLAEARDAYQMGLRYEPGHADCRANYALTLRALGDREGWYREIAQAARENPGNADTRLLSGEAYLERGDFLPGWDIYECRYDLPRTRQLKRQFVQPQWNGEDITGRTILVHDEQGFGDTFQFMRFLPLVKSRGARVVFQVHSDLRGLAMRAAGWDTLITREEAPPPFDLHCPLLSLPRALKTTIDTIPADVPYLTPRDDRLKHWRKQVSSLAKGQRTVGLIWAGRPDFPGERWRSPGLEALLPLFDVPGIRFVVLQMGPARKEMERTALPPSVVDVAEGIKDFEDTAAIMSSLDLVISSCTGPAHLAGALGRPLWMMLSANTDWRWLVDRPDSPWYPTARLFRQPSLGDWAPLVSELRQALIDWNK
ncbi:tetratricopeptide repeat protein [Magnetospirillum sp. 15-1]|uniref:tetratricopeptide repeat protein n=1 Tax=Magnetospirillum sp. 15-1 TaxID=1979370 RepID=UPI000BBB80EA|nr:tetratricopeptide repeat protein [Magnetospirillum sp. 15-1]